MWLSRLRRALGRPLGRSARQKEAGQRFRPRLELLEDRALPSTVPTFTFPFPQGVEPNLFIVTTTDTPTEAQIQGDLYGGATTAANLQFKFDSTYGTNVAYNLDGTPMSLYEAGSYADQLGGSNGNDIYFDIPGKGPFVIKLPFQGGYPGVALTGPFISINGWSQGNLPNHQATSQALLNSSTTGDDARIEIQIDDRFDVEGGNDSIVGVSMDAVDLGAYGGGDNNFIAGDFIGITPGGSSMHAIQEGVCIGSNPNSGYPSNNNEIGGILPQDRNIIADHTDTSLVGGAQVGNGVGIYNGSTGNIIENNIIMGNREGVHFDSTATTGNDIGELGFGNIITGNLDYGVLAEGGSGNYIQDNQITNNGLSGIKITGAADSSNQIQFNTISGNKADGVELDAGASNDLSGNSIFNNGTDGKGAGIVLAAGANDNQTAPDLTSYDGTDLNGTITGQPNTSYTIQVFADSGTDASGKFEGQSYVSSATTTVQTDATGNATFSTPVAAPAKTVVTATATGPDGTSTFSNEVASLDLAPLQVKLSTGFSYDDAKKQYSGAGTILVGFSPAAGQTFQPLLKVDGSATIGNNLFQVTNATVNALIGNVAAPLFQGAFEIKFGTTVTSSLMPGAALPNQFTVAGAQVTLSSFNLVSDASGPHIELRGSLTLPQKLGGFKFTIDKTSFISIGADGVDFTGVTVSDPHQYQIDLDGLTLKASSLSLAYHKDPSAPVLQLGGTFQLVQLGTTITIDPSQGQYFSIGINPQDGSIALGFIGQINIDQVTINSDWSLKSVVLNLAFTADLWNITGTTEIVGPNNTDMQANLSVTPVQGIIFSVTGSPTFALDDLQIQVTALTFLSDRFGGSKGAGAFNPQLQIAANVTLPVDLTGPVADIVGAAGAGDFQFTIPADKPLLIDSTGVYLRAGEISLTGTYTMNLFNSVAIKVTDPSVKFNTQEHWAEFRSTLDFPNLNDATFNFSGKNFVKLADNELPQAVGTIQIPGPIDITTDGGWSLKNIDLTIDTTNNQYTGKATVATPDSTIQTDATINPASFTLHAAGNLANVQLLGMSANLTDFVFISNRTPDAVGVTWNPELDLQGNLTLPAQWGGLHVDISGSQHIAVNSDGVQVTGGTLTLPGQHTFTIEGLLRVTSVDASVALDFANNMVTLGGTYLMPSLNNLSIDLGTAGASFQYSKTGLQFALDVEVKTDSIQIFDTWALNNVDVTFTKTFDDAGSGSGTADLQTPNDTISLSLAFEKGNLQSVQASSNQGVTFQFLGTTVTITSFKFTPDENPADQGDGWAPLVEVQGSMTLPPLMGDIMLQVEKGNHIAIDQSGIGLTGGKISFPNVEFNLADLLDIKATGLALGYTPGNPQAAGQAAQGQLIVQGKLTIPQLHGATADFANPNYISISQDASNNPVVAVVGTLSVNDIVLVPGEWEVKDIALTIDTTQNLIQGDCKVTIPPGVTLIGGLGFKDFEPNYISLGQDNLNLPLGATGAFLQEIQGSINNIASTATDPIQFSGSVGLTLGPQVNLSLPSWAGGSFSGSLVRIDGSATIDAKHLFGSVTVQIVGGVVTGNGNFDLNWSKGVLTANAAVTALGGVISMQANLNANSSADVTLSGTGTVTLPNIPLTPIGGQTIGSGNGYLRYRPSSSLSNDIIMAWGAVNVPVIGPEVLGVEVGFDGSFHVITSQSQVQKYLA